MYISYDALMFVLHNSPDDQQIQVDFALPAYPPIRYIVYCRPRVSSYEVALKIGTRKEIDKRRYHSLNEFISWIQSLKISARLHKAQLTIDLLPISPVIQIHLT